uniref:Uncharacterized protein n=1 Tax=Timema monikensis TaxID=170555 RepID=A0A7R9HLC0_9NEOP|nr:unnamed protein product [Timema monikensis]
MTQKEVSGPNKGRSREERRERDEEVMKTLPGFGFMYGKREKANSEVEIENQSRSRIDPLELQPRIFFLHRGQHVADIVGGSAEQFSIDCLCGLVVSIHGYRSSDPGFNTWCFQKFSVKQCVWNKDVNLHLRRGSVENHAQDTQPKFEPRSPSHQQSSLFQEYRLRPWGQRNGSCVPMSELR